MWTPPHKRKAELSEEMLANARILYDNHSK
jgi:hypothetical protein